MKRRASTHRLDEALETSLDRLSKILRQPKNRLINEAVKLFVQQRSRELEQELEATLATLRTYRQADPNFEMAISAFAESEGSGARVDPVDGVPVAAAGSVQRQIRELFHA